MRGKQDHTRERQLRRQQTEAERLLWHRLRNGRLLGRKFRRQHRIGPYYVDFYCAEARLAVELDGSQHLDQSEYDQRRTRFFESQGCRVQRFWNDAVLINLDLVLDVIVALLNTPHPPCHQPPDGGFDPLPASGARDTQCDDRNQSDIPPLPASGERAGCGALPCDPCSSSSDENGLW